MQPTHKGEVFFQDSRLFKKGHVLGQTRHGYPKAKELSGMPLHSVQLVAIQRLSLV